MTNNIPQTPSTPHSLQAAVPVRARVIRMKVAEARHAAVERQRAAAERQAHCTARARVLGDLAPVSIRVMRASTFEQTKSTGPRWEHDHPVPTSALAALAQLDAHVTARAPAALPPATEVAPPVLKRQRSSGVRTLLEDKIRPLVEFLREHEDREANGTAQRCSSPSSSPSSSLRFEPADALSAAEHIERILGRQGDPDHRWRCLGLEPCAGTLPRTLLRKRFLALALLVHPDKCHLEGAHEAFATLEKAFRELAEER